MLLEGDVLSQTVPVKEWCAVCKKASRLQCGREFNQKLFLTTNSIALDVM